MADNFSTDTVTGGGPTFASDDITSVHFPRVKITLGADGVNDGDVESGNPMPVSGTVTANLSATDNAVLDTIASPVATISATPLQRIAIFDDSDTQITSFGGGTQYTEDAAAPANPVGTAMMMERDDALAGLTPIEGDWTHPYCSANGALWAAIDNTVTVDGSGVTQPISASSLPLPSGASTAANQTTIIGHVDGIETLLTDVETNTDFGATTGGGAELGALRVTIANDSTGVLSIDDNGGAITVDNGGTFAVQVDAALPAGTNAIGKLATNSGVDIGDVDVTSIAAGSNLIGDVGLSGARTSGGTTLYRNIDVDETEDAIKASAGQLYWIHCMNLTASVLYLQIYNATVASVTVGTTTPDLTFPIPTQGDTNGAGFTLAIPNGVAFGTAITVACTTTVGGSSGPAANGCIINAGYA